MAKTFTDENNTINLRNNSSTSTIFDKSTDIPGAYYLAENPKYFEPQRGNTFKLSITGLKEKLSETSETVSVNNYAIDNIEEVIQLSIKSSSVPHFTTEPISINRGNTTMHFAGKSSFGDGKLVVNDYIGAGTKDALLAWQRLVFNPSTEKTGLASDYKMNATLVEYTPEYQVVRTWKIYGCWITGLSEADYDYDTADAKTIDCNIKYDKAIIDFSETEA